MSDKPSTSGRTQPRIVVTGSKQRRIDPGEVATALGAEPMGEAILGNPGPMALFALRAEIMRRRQSTGGRPGIEGTSGRVKIPVREEDWHQLEEIAATMTDSGFSPSPAQVASVLLSAALQSVKSPVAGEQSSSLVGAIARQLAACSPGHLPQG